MKFFLEYAEDTRFLMRILTAIVCIETFIIGILGFSVIKQRIIYINPSSIIGTTNIGYVPDEMVGYFGTAFVSYLGNFNPEAVVGQYKAAFKLMAPGLQSNIRGVFEKDVKDVELNNVTLQTVPLKYEVSSRNENTFSIKIDALRLSYAYGQEAQRVKVLYTINCEKTRPNTYNPFGLQVTRYDFQIEKIVPAQNKS